MNSKRKENDSWWQNSLVSSWLLYEKIVLFNCGSACKHHTSHKRKWTKKPTHLLTTSSSLLHLKAILNTVLTDLAKNHLAKMSPVTSVLKNYGEKNKQPAISVSALKYWRFAVGAHRFFHFQSCSCNQKHPLLLQMGDENFWSFCSGSFFSHRRRWRRLTVNSGRWHSHGR